MTSTADGGLDLDPVRLTAAANILDSTAGSLADSVPSLRRRPDAGGCPHLRC